MLNDSKVLSTCELALGTLLPVTNYLPPGEPGAQVDQARVIGPRCPEELVRADVTLAPAPGEIPVGQSKGLVAHQALQWTEMHSFGISSKGKRNKGTPSSSLTGHFTEYSAFHSAFQLPALHSAAPTPSKRLCH